MSAITESESQIFVGWIRGSKRDVIRLKVIGVQGDMIYDKGIISRCECSRSVLDKLEVQYPKFWRSSFTVLDESAYRVYINQFEQLDIENVKK